MRHAAVIETKQNAHIGPIRSDIVAFLRQLFCFELFHHNSNYRESRRSTTDCGAFPPPVSLGPGELIGVPLYRTQDPVNGTQSFSVVIP